MKTLMVTDLDGTLLNAEGRVDAESARIISRLTDAGALITVATARTPATVQPLLADTRTSLPAIVMTGAALWDRNSLSYLDARLLDASAHSRVDAAFAAAGLHPFVYVPQTDGRLLVYHGGGSLSDVERRFVDERTGLPLKRFMLNAQTPADARRILMFGMGSVDQAEAVAAALRPCPDCSVSCYRDTYTPGIGLVEVFAPNVSKAEAVLRLKAETGAHRLVVYGDNLNDLPMMAVADLAVAPANALPQVRQAAHTVIGPNTDNSVARHMEQIFTATA